jgi:hypothetical protein
MDVRTPIRTNPNHGRERKVCPQGSGRALTLRLAAAGGCPDGPLMSATKNAQSQRPGSSSNSASPTSSASTRFVCGLRLATCGWAYQVLHIGTVAYCPGSGCRISELVGGRKLQTPSVECAGLSRPARKVPPGIWCRYHWKPERRPRSDFAPRAPQSRRPRWADHRNAASHRKSITSGSNNGFGLWAKIGWNDLSYPDVFLSCVHEEGSDVGERCMKGRRLCRGARTGGQFQLRGAVGADRDHTLCFECPLTS